MRDGEGRLPPPSLHLSSLLGLGSQGTAAKFAFTAPAAGLQSSKWPDEICVSETKAETLPGGPGGAGSGQPWGHV